MLLVYPSLWKTTVSFQDKGVSGTEKKYDTPL